jgi:hypothetical protein
MPPHLNVNKMKKYFAVIIGVTLGLSASALMSLSANNVAYGEINSAQAALNVMEEWWHGVVAFNDTSTATNWLGGSDALLSWEDIFNPLGPTGAGTNLYQFLWLKLTNEAEDQAINDIAKSNGLTPDEAAAVAGGSVTAIFNNPSSGDNLSLEDALKISKGIQEDFAFRQEILQLKQEAEVVTKPAEMFANGDTSDSGFDLIHDLNVIEEILFFNKSPVTIGGTSLEDRASGEDPTQDKALAEDTIEDKTAEAILTPGLTVEPGADTAELHLDGDGLIDLTLPILPGDICEVPSAGDDDDDDSGDDDDDAGVASSAGDDDDDEVEGDGGEGAAPDDASDEEEEDSSLEVAADDWTKVWCPGFDQPGVGAAQSGGQNFDLAKLLPSVGGKQNSSLFAAGAGASVDSPGFQANIGICFSLDIIKKTVSSYQPGQSCIACEVEEINELLDKTLSHTLIPGKATGNLFESAKCKQGFQDSVLTNIQFILITNPIPTPPNDDLILGKNIFEELNSFADDYRPLLFKDLITVATPEDAEKSREEITKRNTEFAPNGLSQSDLYNEVQKTIDISAAQAELRLKTATLGNEATNSTLFSRNILLEMRQMNNLFDNYRKTWLDIVENSIMGLKSKPEHG